MQGKCREGRLKQQGKHQAWRLWSQIIQYYLSVYRSIAFFLDLQAIQSRNYKLRSLKKLIKRERRIHALLLWFFRRLDFDPRSGIWWCFILLLRNIAFAIDLENGDGIVQVFVLGTGIHIKGLPTGSNKDKQTKLSQDNLTCNCLLLVSNAIKLFSWYPFSS